MAYMNTSGTIIVSRTDYLAHHGIKGQKWGVRRYQNADGSYTAAGKRRLARQYTKDLNKLEQSQATKVARYASLQKLYTDADDHTEKAKYKNDTEKVKKYEDLKDKYLTLAADLVKRYPEDEKKLNNLLDKVKADENVVWRTYQREYMNYDPSLGDKLGLTRTYMYGDKSLRSAVDMYQEYDHAKGTGYRVKSATDKRKNSYKYNSQANKKRYERIPVHTE